MKALILAAGSGTRLKEKTKDLPKCLVPVNGKPLLEYQLDALAANNIKDIVILVGYKADKIKQFLSSKDKFKILNLTFVENPDYATTNSSYSFWLAKDEIRHEPYIHLNSDIIFAPQLLSELINHLQQNVLLVDKNVALDNSMEQVVLDGDKIIFMDKANLPNAVGRGSGMAKLSPSAVSLMIAKVEEHLQKGDKNQHCHGLMRSALRAVDFYALDAKHYFFTEINTEEELHTAEKFLPSYFIDNKQKFITVLFGFPACGKTHTSRSLLDYCSKFNRTVLLSTFSIREELGLVDLYSPEEREIVYREIIARAKSLMKSGHANIILDGNFNKFSRRKLIYDAATESGYQLFVVHCNVSDEKTIVERLEQRRKMPKSLEHASSTMDLYRMIKDSSDHLSVDAKEKMPPNIINVNTETESIFLEHNVDCGSSDNATFIIDGIKHGFPGKKEL